MPARLLFFPGSATGLAAVPAWTFRGDISGMELGSSVGGGDIDGDGFSDVILLDEHGIRVFTGSGAGLPSTPSWTLSSPPPVFLVGNRAGDLATGDLDADGYADLVFTSLETRGQSISGRLFAYSGSAQGWRKRASRISTWQGAKGSPLPRRPGT